MTLTIRQRIIALAVLMVGIGVSLALADNEEYGWYFVAAVLLPVAWLVTQLPSPEAAELPPPSRVAAGTRTQWWEVPVQFVGEAGLVLNRLREDGYTVSGEGPATERGLGVLVVQVAGNEAVEVRRRAGRIVRQTGALVQFIGAAKPVR